MPQHGPHSRRLRVRHVRWPLEVPLGHQLQMARHPHWVTCARPLVELTQSARRPSSVGTRQLASTGLRTNEATPRVRRPHVKGTRQGRRAVVRGAQSTLRRE